VKIENSVKPVGGSPVAQRQKPAKAAASAEPAAGPQVEVSSSSALQGATEAIAGTPVVNADRVAEIRQAILDGRFQVNADRIAGSLLDSVRQILSSQR
jgi:negative regulator of flagellin synthesis FlgM